MRKKKYTSSKRAPAAWTLNSISSQVLVILAYTFTVYVCVGQYSRGLRCTTQRKIKSKNIFFGLYLEDFGTREINQEQRQTISDRRWGDNEALRL